MRQFHCNAKCKFQTKVKKQNKFFNMIILDVFSGFGSVESYFCTEEKFCIKLAHISISHVTLI